jgi:hypothetical protein
MRMFMSTYGSLGDVGPMMAVVAQVRALGAEAWA